MPNTPLLERLLQACAAARTGERKHHDAATSPTGGELHGPPLSRRGFLGASALGLGLAACDRAEEFLGPNQDARAARAPSDARVVVVGGGLAGLTCAYRLQQAGVRATLYEASTRLGGRCWTNRSTFSGLIAEHGGELIDQSHTNIRQLSQELGLKLVNLLRMEANGAEPFYHFGGSPYSYADATRDLRAIWQPLHRDVTAAGYPTLYNRYTAAGRELDAVSLAQWIDRNVPGGRQSRLGSLLETAYVIEYGAPAEEQSSLNLIYLLGYIGPGQLRIFGPSNEKYRVDGGNDQIVERLVERLGEQVVTGAPLLAIRRTSAGAFDLTFGRGRGSESVRADHVVLALPFPILRDRVDIRDAGFDPIKLTAIRELRMGVNGKLAVEFDGRPWETLGNTGETYADTGYQATWDASRGQQPGRGLLLNYTGADVTVAQRGSAGTLASRFLRQIEPVLPGLAAHATGRSHFDRWGPDAPWTGGSYSYWGVGQYTRFAGAERERSGNCYFAGEHTSVDFQGYLNGAVESGDRAAAELLGTLRGRAVA